MWVSSDIDFKINYIASLLSGASDNGLLSFTTHGKKVDCKSCCLHY